VDNFDLGVLGRIYLGEDPEAEIYRHGVPLLSRSGVAEQPARNFLRSLINRHGAGRTLDALMVTLLEQPIEPKAYLAAVAAKIGAEIPKDWAPPAECLAQLEALGVPPDVYRDARDVFVTWFREMGIRHGNFPALFVRWCQRDWDRSEANRAVYRRRLAMAGGFGEVFKEPA